MRCFVHRPALVLLLVLGTSLAPLAAQSSQAPSSPALADASALIGDFPHPGSDADKADQAILLWLQRTRTREDMLRAASEVTPHLGLFSEVTGKDLESGPYPLTRALAEQAQQDVRKVVAALKTQYARPRPYVAMPQLSPAIQRETSFAYPSGHASWGMMEAELLATLQPQRREAILARGRQVGYDRVLGGVHYPSDVEAGQRLGPVLAKAWLADPAHRKRVEAARAAEW